MNPTSPSRRRDSVTFKELAKLAEMAPAFEPAQSTAVPAIAASEADGGSSTAETPERKENSGLINLAGLTQAAASAPAPAAAPTPAPAEAAKARRWPRGPHLIAILAGIAAAGIMLIATRRHARALPVAAVERPPVPAIDSAAVGHMPAPPTPIAVRNESGDRSVDPSTLPAPSSVPLAGASPTPRPLARASSQATAAPSASAAPSSSAAALTSEATSAVVVPSSSAPVGDGRSLQALMEQAVGVAPGAAPAAPSATPTTGDGAEGSIPLKPSVGAVQSALRASLPAVHACLDPDSPISRAVVTFRSDGSAQNVSISGWAAGKPVEACVREALMKARVPPFVQDTYSAPVTIRGE